MADRRFAHLHCHTHYSLLDGFNRIPELVAQTKKLGMNSCAITDHGNLYGAIEFYSECKKAGVNPVIGYEAYVAPGDRREKKFTGGVDKNYHLTILAKNTAGFKNLIKLSSLAFLEGFYYNPRIDLELLEAHSEGLIVLSGCLAGQMNQHILKDQTKDAEKLLKWYRRVFGDDFYLEVQNNGLEIQDQCNEALISLANRTGVPLVATADAHYLCATDAEAHDVLFCINTGKKRDPNKKSYPEGRLPNPYFVRSPADMHKLFPGMEDAVNRSATIADGVHIELDFKKRFFPRFDLPPAKTADEYLKELCLLGVAERYGPTPPAGLLDRLDHELGVISKMGFAGYFLVVWDFVRFAREQNIPCSARGSGCGAVVSYVLYMSHVDPLDYDLLFERFLDVNRTEPPDIDIDFCQERREKVIEYVKQKYGKDSVAQIGTFGTLAAKAALKDVGRVLDIPLDRVNMMTKLVPMKGAIALSLDDALANPDFRREYEGDSVTRVWVDIARKLEGTNRNVGTHAAGVVIADGPITDYVPVQRVVRKADSDEGAKGEVAITTQWEMGIIEKVGMLKMDFLGLRTLTLVDNAVKLIKKTRGVDIDVQKLPLDDAATYVLLQKGDAKGVFQFESEGIRELLKRMKPDNIRDIVACTALYRPGPLEGGMVDEYIECKHGRKKPKYPHPVMEEVLSETFAVMVYQEQVMRVLNRLGGIELSSAYACIKAISKKKEDIIDARKADFIAGAGRLGLDAAKAQEIFELIVKFGGYGFNKSHSAAYAHVTYHTAYLKTHYPAEFMAALLSSEIDDGNKRDMLVDHIADAKRMGVSVLPPDVNRGSADFDVVEGQIVFGLTAIKGLGRGAAEEIVRAREAGGKFKDLYDFCERIDLRGVPKSAIERLIKAGAMDAFGTRSGQVMALDNATSSAEQRLNDRKRGQKNIFDVFGGDDAPEAPKSLAAGLPPVAEWPELEKLKFEKEALDFYISSHPLAQFDDQLRRFRTASAAEIPKAKNSENRTIGGMVTNLAVKTTKTGKRFALFRLEDFTGQAKCVLWSEEFIRFKELIQEDKIVLCEGIVEWGDRAEPDFVVKRMLTVEDAKKEFTKTVIVRMPYSEDDEVLRKLETLGKMLNRSRGPCPVYLTFRDTAGRAAQFKLGNEFMVNPSALKVDELEMLLGAGSVVFTR